jgi:hypothetical protein
MCQLRTVIGLIILIAAAGSSTSAQTNSADWTELRRRLAQNLEMGSFLAKCQSKDSKEVRFTSAEPISLRKTDPEGNNQTQVPSLAGLGLDRQDVVRRAACSEGVPPDVALAIIEYESNFDNDVRGSAGEIGASQILPATIDAFEFDRARLGSDYEYNVRSGMKVLGFLLAQFPTEDAIRAYNGGPAFQESSAEARSKVESYFANIDSLRRKYEWVRCR